MDINTVTKWSAIMHRYVKTLSLILTTVSAVLWMQAATALPFYTGIVVLGDSLSDTGNSEILTPGGDIPGTDFTYGDNGRFTNGPVWAEYLSDLLGTGPLTPSRSGGNNYAHGGAQIDATPGPTTGLVVQYQQWLSDTGGVADPSKLYVVAAGSNDVMSVPLDATPAQVAGFISERLTTYYAILTGMISHGATDIVVPNLGNLGRTPEALNSGVPALVTGLVSFWNVSFSAMLDQLLVPPTVNLYQVDMFAATEHVFATPEAYGFYNTTNPCSTVVGGVESSCANPDSYIFWDRLHPTTAAHKFLADAAFSQIVADNLHPVPVPPTLTLIVIGLLGIGWRQRRYRWIARRSRLSSYFSRA